MIRKITTIFVALAVVIGGYLVLTKTPLDRQAQPDMEQPADVITIASLPADNIVAISIETKDHSYTLQKKEGTWLCAQQQTLEIDQFALSSLVGSFAPLTAKDHVASGGHLFEYGLDQPQGKTTVTLEDGTQTLFLIGNQTPIGDAYYLKKEGRPEIYAITTAKAQSFMAPLSHYREKLLFQMNEDDLAVLQIKRADATIEIKRKEQGEAPLDNNIVQSDWKMTSPYTKDVDMILFSDQVLKSLSFSVLDFVDDAPTSYGKYGLDAPSCELSIADKGNRSFSLLVGKEAPQGVYVRVKGKPNVYVISADTVAFAKLSPTAFLDPLVYVPSIDKVEKIVFSAGGKTRTLRVEHKGETSADNVYFVDDQSVSKELFLPAYQNIVAPAIRGGLQTKGRGNLLCKIETTYNHGASNDVVEFYEYEDRYAGVAINGKANFYVMRSQVQTMIETVMNLPQ